MFTLAQTRRVYRSPLVSAPDFRLSLRRDDLWRVELRGEALPIRCLRGAVWITREGSSEDVVLRAGGECRLGGRGLALVGAVTDAEVSVGT
jgi:hypothetical protein